MGGAKEISGHLAAAHRHPDQVAHLRRGRQARRGAIGQGVGQGQSHGHFPQIGKVLMSRIGEGDTA